MRAALVPAEPGSTSCAASRYAACTSTCSITLHRKPAGSTAAEVGSELVPVPATDSDAGRPEADGTARARATCTPVLVGCRPDVGTAGLKGSNEREPWPQFVC